MQLKYFNKETNIKPCNISDTGKRRWLEQEEKPMGEPQCMVYSRSLKSLLVSHATSASDGGV